jgi:flagellar FliL protein
MGDVVDFGEGSDQQEPAAPEKRKAGGFPILKILLFAGLGILAVGLIITVVVITMKVMVSQGNVQTKVPVGEEYQEVLPAYAYSSLLPEMRLSTADKPAATVVVKVLVGYDKGNKELEAEITDRQPQIRDSLRNYFSMKKVADFAPEKERKLKEEIRSNLNGIMESKGIRDILFEKLQTIEQ